MSLNGRKARILSFWLNLNIRQKNKKESHIYFEQTIPSNIREINYHKENKTNGGKQIEFSAESNQFEKTIKSGNK